MNEIKIVCIEYGWFKLQVGENIIRCSNYLNFDTPRFLLKALLNLSEKKTCEEWICWQDEPEGYVMRLMLSGNKMNVEVYGSDLPAFKLSASESFLKASAKNCLFDAELDFLHTVQLFVKEFGFYANGRERIFYDENWMTFPQEEYGALKKYSSKY